MNLIIINGMPATGKTTIAHQISQQLGLKLIAKDTIKEFLFDLLGVEDREWSRKLGTVTNDFLYEIAGVVLGDGKSVIIENAFEAQFARPKLESLIQQYHPNVIEVYCFCDPAVRRKRFVERNESGLRHEGHRDEENYPSEGESEPIEKYAALNVGTVIKVDTNEVHPTNYSDIITRLSQILE